MNLYRTKLSEKLKESLEAVVPIIAIVLILSFTIAPVPPGILMAFIIGAILLVVGMMFFTLGAEMSMTPMGERIGTRIAQSKRLPVIIGLCFILGFIITISEPDLQVLAGQVPSVSNMTLILAVAVGVGIFLVAAVLRMLFSKPLSYMLLIFYPVVFILTFFVSKDFLAIAFDSGGVTTGPMTVPFIMALGIGFSAVRSDKYAETDSFGLVSLCSIGPVLAVLLLGIIYHPQGGSYSETVIPDAETSVALWKLFESGIPHYMKEIGGSLLPIILFFTFFQVVSLKLKKKMLIKILVGILYTYIGLVLFLTGVNVCNGSYHEVDSSEMAFHIAGSLAFKDAMKKASPVLLEPIMIVEVTMPEEYMGDVIGDINSRRGRIEGMDDLGGGKIVRGFVPLSEMFGYSTDLRSRTQGRGNYSMFVEKYEPVPKSVQEKILSSKND